MRASRGAQAALPEIAWRAGGDDVVPGRLAAARARDQVIEGQVLARAAILAGEAVAQEHVEPREGRVARRLDIGLERHHRGQLHREGRAVHRRLVFRDDVHAVEEHRLDGVLPRPQRQRIVAERPVIGIEDQRRIGPRRDSDIH